MSARRVSVLRAATPRDTLEALRRQYGGRIERTIADYTADIWHVNPCPVP
jgi:hypothetical protein